MAFKPNLALARELRRLPEHRKGLAVATEPARQQVAQLAQVAGAPWMRSGRGDQIKIEVTDDGVFLVNLDHAGHLQEWGSKNNPPVAPLRRGVRAAGLRLAE